MAVASFTAFGQGQASRLPFVQAEFSRMGDTAHLEFKGLKNWRYDVQKSGPSTVTMTIPPIDEASQARLQSYSDVLIKSVQVNKQGVDGNFSLTFNLTQADVESFDYLTDDPSRLIVDFYRKATPAPAKPVAEAAAAKPAVTAKKAAPKKGDAKKPQGDTAEGEYTALPNAGRKPAGDEFISGVNNAVDEKGVPLSLQSGIFDGGDDNYDRFRIKDYEIREEAIISSRHNVYLPFPMLKMPVSQLNTLMEQRPEFIINPKDTRENKEARLLLTLFERNRYAVFLKTYDYFMTKYPDSEYNEIIKNLAAHVYLSRWRKEGKAVDFERARALYLEQVQKFPDSPIREHNYMLIGYAQMERGDALATLQTFEGFIKSYPKSPEIPQVRKALAEAYLILRKYDEATAEYQAIMRDFPKTAHAYEAKYRLGDVSFNRADFSGAITTYEGALKDLPLQEKTYPNVDFNMAEARFWQKDFKKSLENYIRFVNLYPNHDYGGYALTRIGELLEILGADQRRVMGAYLESYFRFPTHPGAKVARIRMLSRQMRGMKAKELKKALEEIEETAQNLNLPGMKEFTTLMVAEGLTHRGEYKQALENLITYYQKNPTSANLDSFKSRILRNISNELRDEVVKGQFIDALKFYSQYSETWLKNSDRIDVPYFIAGAYENAGAYTEAQKIYEGALASRSRIVGTMEEKEKAVQEHLPSVDSINLRLASTMVQERDYINAYQHLKAIGQGPNLSPPETIERVQLAAQIAEQKNDHQKARESLLELARKWQGDTALMAPVHLKLAQTFLKLGDAKTAEAHADKVLASEGGETKIADKVIADTLNVKAEALVAQKRELGAVESYMKLLERYEDKMPLGQVRYKVGQILFDRGDFKGASEVWQRLAGTNSEYLWKIGKEKLENAKWTDDYNKYISRIPAMAKETK